MTVKGEENGIGDTSSNLDEAVCIGKEIKPFISSGMGK